MTLQEKINGCRRTRLLAAVVLNLAVLVCMLLIIKPAYESNDDLMLASFVDGQRALMTAHVPYINIVLGGIMKLIYTVLGKSIAWHTIGQYLLIFASFTVLSYVFLERLRAWQAALISIILLITIGADMYMIISYTKTASACTVAGALLIADAAEYGAQGSRLTDYVVGIILCAFGFMLRSMEFFACLAIMGAPCLHWLWGFLFAKQEKSLKSFISYVNPFVIMLIAVAALWGINHAAWAGEPWRIYRDYDAVRVAYTDYGKPDYDKLTETYAALGLTESAVKLANDENYYDTERFDSATLQAISEARKEILYSPSIGECLGKFLDKCLLDFFVHIPVWGFVLVFMLWLCAGEHDFRGYITLAFALGMFSLLYLYLIYRGRYMVDRVDAGLFLALSAVLAYTLRGEKLENEKGLCAGMLLLGILVSYFMWRPSYRFGSHREEQPDRAREQQIINTLVSDEEHIFLAKTDAISDNSYAPFETAAPLYREKIVLLGGWNCQHPLVTDDLAGYGIVNPYKDIIGNEKAYLIDEDIDLTLDYIHEYYDSAATAQRVEELCENTGLNIYRIIAGGGEK